MFLFFFSIFATIIRYRIFLLFRKIMQIRSPIRFKRMTESPWRGYYYLRRIYVPRYFVAAFSKLFNYKIYSHFCLIFDYFCPTFFLFFLSFSSNFLFLFIFFGISLIFHKFYTHITYIRTHIYVHYARNSKIHKIAKI